MSNEAKQKVVVPLLTFLSGEREGEQVAISGPRFTVGRDPACDLVLTDMSVSAEHAEVRCEKNIWSVRDKGSSNGTTHNGSPTSLAIIKNGDRIGFGDLLFRFNTPPPQTLAIATAFNPRRAKNATSQVELDSAMLAAATGSSSLTPVADMRTTVNLDSLDDDLATWVIDVFGPLRSELAPWIVGQRQNLLDGLLISLLCGGHLRVYGLPDSGLDRMLASFCENVGFRFGLAPFEPGIHDPQCEVVLADSSVCLDETTRNLVAGSRDGRLPVEPLLFVLRCPPSLQITIPAHWFLLSVPIHEGSAEEEEAMSKALLEWRAEGQTVDLAQLARVKLTLRQAAALSDLHPVAVRLTRLLRPHPESSDEVRANILRGPGVGTAADLVHAAQAAACLRGSGSPTLADLAAVAPSCLIHRIRLRDDARIGVPTLIQSQIEALCPQAASKPGVPS